MPANKRQHFVPQFYLRDFLSDPTHKTINIFNIKRETSIFGANLRSQCYKDYFYGKLPEFETGLGLLEGSTSGVLRNITVTDAVPDSQQAVMVLCMFVVVQYLRTVAAETDTNEMIDRVMKTIYRVKIEGNKLAGVRIRLEDAAAFNVATALMLSPVCYDLKPAVLINGHHSELITSDNPVSMVNRFWRGRFPGPGNNLAAAGLLVFLPLSPRHTLLLYDQNVYSVPKSPKNSIFIRRRTDVLSINELQILRASDNLYFAQREQAPCIEKQFQLHKERRRSSYIAVDEFVPGATPGSYVRPESDDEISLAGRSLVLSERLGIDATLRLSFVQLRPKPRYFFDGSAAGALRDPAWVKVLDDFSEGVKDAGWHFGDLEAFARLHPLWQDVGLWKRRSFGP